MRPSKPRFLVCYCMGIFKRFAKSWALQRPGYRIVLFDALVFHCFGLAGFPNCVSLLTRHSKRQLPSDGREHVARRQYKTVHCDKKGSGAKLGFLGKPGFTCHGGFAHVFSAWHARCMDMHNPTPTQPHTHASFMNTMKQKKLHWRWIQANEQSKGTTQKKARTISGALMQSTDEPNRQLTFHCLRTEEL